MKINFELPDGTILVARDDLKLIIKEMLTELKVEASGSQILTIKETAALLKVSIPTIRNLISTKQIPFFQRGQIIRFNQVDVLEWMRGNNS